MQAQIPLLELVLRDGSDESYGVGGGYKEDGTPRNRHAAPYLESDDKSVIEGIRSGDARMFERLYTAYLNPLFDFALGYVRDKGTAEDIVATVMANLWSRRKDWVVRDRVETYMFGAVYREVLSRSRTDIRQERITAAFGDTELERSVGAPPLNPHLAAEQHDMEERVWAAVDALPTRYRTAAVLRWRRDMGYGEIAEVMGISPDAARQLVSRAVRMIRDWLKV